MNRHLPLPILIDILASCPSEDALVSSALDLKRIHTQRVAENCGLLACASGLDAAETRLAQHIGWCHDLGRFPQFAMYRTFDDSCSVDHGVYSLKMAQLLGLSRQLTAREKGLFWSAIKLHNQPCLPRNLPEKAHFFATLIRDADRLDIFRIFVDYYRNGPVAGSPLELGYPDTGEVSSAVAESILSGQSPPYQMGKSVQDMRLIKLSWIYTLETPGAMALVQQSGIVGATRAVVPHTPLTQRIYDAIQRHIALNV